MLNVLKMFQSYTNTFRKRCFSLQSVRHFPNLSLAKELTCKNSCPSSLPARLARATKGSKEKSFCPCKLHLNLLVYAQNIFGSSSVVFGNLQLSLENVWNCLENVWKCSSGIPNNFGNLQKVVKNLRKIIQNVVISMFNNNSCLLVDMEFLFSCLTCYLTYLFAVLTHKISIWINTHRELPYLCTF